MRPTGAARPSATYRGRARQGLSQERGAALAPAHRWHHAGALLRPARARSASGAPGLPAAGALSVAKAAMPRHAADAPSPTNIADATPASLAACGPPRRYASPALSDTLPRCAPTGCLPARRCPRACLHTACAPCCAGCWAEQRSPCALRAPRVRPAAPGPQRWARTALPPCPRACGAAQRKTDRAVPLRKLETLQGCAARQSRAAKPCKAGSPGPLRSPWADKKSHFPF